MLGKVMIGKGKRGAKEQWLYITDKDGNPRSFASKSELRRAAFTQFGDDLNVLEEVEHGTQGTAGTDRRDERLGQEETPDGGSLLEKDTTRALLA